MRDGRFGSALVALLAVVCASCARSEHQVFLPHEFEKVLAEDASVEKLAGGLLFVEGPVWLPDEEALVFSDIHGEKLLRWSAARGLETLRDCPSPNGNTLDLEGRLVTCEHGSRSLTRTLADGTVELLVDRHEGKRFHSPNDVVVRSDGSLWFTDPPYGLRGRTPELEGTNVFRFDPESGATSIVSARHERPNGLCFSPDESLLYVNDSGSQPGIWVYEVAGDELRNGRLFADTAPARPDGLRCDAAGRIWCAADDGIHLYLPGGELVAKIAVPEPPRNLCFGGASGSTLFITAGKSLYALDLKAGAGR